jgi:tellurite resistance protein
MQRITPNLFGIATGIAGLAALWQVAHGQGLVPAWPSAGFAATAAVVWGTLVVARARRRLLFGEWRDPVLGPFVALLPIGGMVLGLALRTYASAAGTVVFAVFALSTLVLAVRIAAAWAADPPALRVLHSGYLLPTVAGGFLAAAGFARVGQLDSARIAFGLGLLCWVVLGSVVLVRLVRGPRLPAALVPTLAIEITPPVLAGNALLAINGDRLDALTCVFGIWTAAAALVQLALLPRFLRNPFRPGVWAFAFSYAATASYALRWVDLTRPAGAAVLSGLVLALVTGLVAVLAARTVARLLRGTFLPGGNTAPLRYESSPRTHAAR